MDGEISAVIYGKHRAFGDFLMVGLPQQAQARLDAWLEEVLPQLRANLGENWEAAWSGAQPIRFWIGPSLLGVPVIGIFMTSADKVGRRFPLLFGLAGALAPPPVDRAFDAAPYDALWAHIAGFRMPEGAVQGGNTLLRGFEIPEVEGLVWNENDVGTLWGQRGDGDLQRLLKDARLHDALQAQYTRSHWWKQASNPQNASWLACNGLPDAEALEWVLTGQARKEEA